MKSGMMILRVASSALELKAADMDAPCFCPSNAIERTVVTIELSGTEENHRQAAGYDFGEPMFGWSLLTCVMLIPKPLV